MRALALVASVGLAASTVSCIHTRQTKSQEEASKEGKPKAAPVRSETIETSKTTKQMFKPEGLKKLQVQDPGVAARVPEGQGAACDGVARLRDAAKIGSQARRGLSERHAW